MRFFFALMLSFALASVQVSPVMSNSLVEEFRRQSRHMAKHTPDCRAGPIDVVVRSTDLKVIRETYGTENHITPTYIKMKICGAMGRDLNVYAGKCSSRSTCKPREISMETHYFQIRHMETNAIHYVPVEIDNHISCECK